jgi:DNA anti-recombination protein RmuC|tara:strand:- start:6081 stop:6257 length:177 start_codon:yes stop_codon:yes gene_type:complete
MKNVEKIQEVLSEVQNDVEKFVGNGNKAAGTRIRKAMQEIKNLAQSVRTEVQTIKNSD